MTRAEVVLRRAMEDAVAAAAGGAGPEAVATALLDLAATCELFVGAGLVGPDVGDAVVGEAHDAVVLRGHPAPLRLPPLPDVGELVVAASAGSAPAGGPPDLVAVVPVGCPVPLLSGDQAVITSVELWSDHTVVRVVPPAGPDVGAPAPAGWDVPAPPVGESWVAGPVGAGDSRLVVAPDAVVTPDPWAPAAEITLDLAGAVPCREASASPAAPGVPADRVTTALDVLAERHLARIRRLGYEPVSAARREVRAAAAALGRAGVVAGDVVADLDAVLVAAGFVVPPPGPPRPPRADWHGFLAAPRGPAALRRVVAVARRLAAAAERDAVLVSVEDWGGEWRLRVAAGDRGWGRSLEWRARDDAGRLYVGEWAGGGRGGPHGEDGEVVFEPGLAPDCRSVTVSPGSAATAVSIVL